jgi:hypothetical protein
MRMISCTSTELLILIRVLRPLEMQRSYKARKSAVEAEEAEVEATGSGEDHYGQHQPRMASLIRFRWRSDEVCEAEL